MSQVTPPPIPPEAQRPLITGRKLTAVQLQLIVGVAVCVLVSTLASGIPSWMALIVLLLVAAALKWRSLFAFYLASFIVGALMLIPWLRDGSSQPQLYPIDLIYVLAFVGMLGCGLSYFETFSSHYEIWSQQAREIQPDSSREQLHPEWVNQSGKQNAFSQWWLMALVGIAMALFVLWLVPEDSRWRMYYAMVPRAARVCLILLYLFIPTWALSSILSIIAWRFIGPKQAGVFVWREFHDEQGRELRSVERRISKLSK